jgi:polar amino acid transport system substrate-binding protein
LDYHPVPDGSAGCDILLDVIADREAQSETNLRISKAYYRTGVALAVPSASKLTSFKSLNEHTKVGVQVGSMAAMIIGQRHVPISLGIGWRKISWPNFARIGGNTEPE